MNQIKGIKSDKNGTNGSIYENENQDQDQIDDLQPKEGLDQNKNIQFQNPDNFISKNWSQNRFSKQTQDEEVIIEQKTQNSKDRHHSQFNNLTRNYGTLIRKRLKKMKIESKILEVQTTNYQLFHQLLYDDELKGHIKGYISNQIMLDIDEKTSKNMSGETNYIYNQMMSDIDKKTSKNMSAETKILMKEWFPKLQKAVEEGQKIIQWNKIQ